MFSTTRYLTAAILVIAPLAACSSISNGTITKEEARELNGVDADGNDICAQQGWYGDNVCDDFCVETDPDCPVANCPDPNDPSVHYAFTDPDQCAVSLIACDENQVYFGSPDCGCGCIDEAPPGDDCGGIAGLTCAKGQFCEYPVSSQCGGADELGKCKDAPEACAEIYAPVCGCDGKTYGNACEANGNGQSILHAGECEQEQEQCGGIAGLTCADGKFCDFPVGECGGSDQLGICKDPPQECYDLYAPVCGCDGKTYSNSCDANGNGQSVAHDGECDGPQECGGFLGLVCDAGEFCNLDFTCQIADASGFCEPLLDACVDIFEPVCSCDGTTYPSACEAHLAGAVVGSLGSCEDPVIPCGGFGGDIADCPAGLFCDYELKDICGFADALGHCEPIPQACAEIFSPVCGCDSKDYGNECEANAAGVAVLNIGECTPFEPFN